MFRNLRLQMVAVLAAGALGGWLAGSGRIQSLRVQAAPPDPAATAPATAACCDGAERGVLLAKADLPAAAALPLLAGQPAGGGKKPNILFIMGDDIGMWNIGAYHRGLMAGRTPNLDKLAK